MAIPETDLVRLRRWAENRVPASFRDTVRVEVEAGERLVTIVERRAPWKPELGSEWSRLVVARLRHDATARSWTLHWCDSKGRWHPYEACPPTPSLALLLAEIDRDPTGIFWG